MEKIRVAENKMFHVDGHDFLFLAADKAIFEMDALTKRVLSCWSQKQEWVVEDALRDMEGSSEERAQFLEDLMKRRGGFSVNGTGVVSRHAHAGYVPIPLKTLVIHVTDACNLACRYCYYSEAGISAGKMPRMPLEVARRSVEFLFDHSGQQEQVVLVFFGGEPLLNFNLITAIVPYARKLAKDRGKTVDFVLTTNGTLLTRDVVAFLRENNVGITVSIDGDEKVHDRHRRFPDGSSSYRVIAPNLKHLFEAAGQRPVVARVTLVDHPENVPKIFDHLMGLGFVEVGFSPVTSGKPDHQLSRDDMDLLLVQFEKLSDRFLESMRRGEFFGFSNLIDLLVSLHQDEVKQYPCGAGLGLFSVSPNGRLYLCQRFTGQDEFCMGDVFTGFEKEKVNRFRQESHISQKKECKTCWMRTICTGGCYHEACVREGSHLKPNLHYCEWIKKWGEMVLNIYGRISIVCPEYLETLSMTRGYTPMVKQ